MISSFFDRHGFPILTVVFMVLFLLETKFGLRKRVQKRWGRVLINFIVSIPSFALLRLLFIPAIIWLSIKNESFHFGITYLFDAPVWFKFCIAFLLLDYSNYLWHILLHRLPVLWRFHLVHHTDLDLDVTTAFRFHFGELIGSVFFRGAAVVLTGAGPMLVLVYEIAFEAATQFQHTNVCLPLGFEKVLNLLLVTPRMHGIHHSVIKKQTDSNYSIIFSFWDRIHQTDELKTLPDKIVIGVPAYPDKNELTVKKLLLLPFTKIRPWN